MEHHVLIHLHLRSLLHITSIRQAEKEDGLKINDKGIEMKIGPIMVVAYMVITVCVSFYRATWSETAFRGFAWNFGQSLFWPFFLFPGLGKFIGGVLLLIIILGVVLRR